MGFVWCLMPNRRATTRRLDRAEIRQAFQGEAGEVYPNVISPVELAHLLKISRSTIYAWTQEGRFDGAYVKRGKHLRFWRDRALECFFSAPEWRPHGDKK